MYICQKNLVKIVFLTTIFVHLAYNYIYHYVIESTTRAIQSDKSYENGACEITGLTSEPSNCRRYLYNGIWEPWSSQNIASVSIMDASTIVIQPWDRSLIKDIEKGISDAKI